MTGLAGKDARPNLHYDLVDPNTGVNYGCPPKGWRFERSTMARKVAEGRVVFPADPTGRPRHKLFLEELKTPFKNLSSIITSTSTAEGTREANRILGPGVFPFPKPTRLIASFVEQVTANDDLVLDFFAGSGTVGHAVLELNQRQQANRRCISIQLPQPLDKSVPSDAAAAALCDELRLPRSIAEITKERLRRAGRQVRDANPTLALDTGFRVYKLDESSFKLWDPAAESLAQALTGHVSAVRDDRTDEDLATELLLKLGFELNVPCDLLTVAGKAVRAVGSTLYLCFDPFQPGDVDAFVDAMGALHTERSQGHKGDCEMIFRDDRLQNDAVKTNLAKGLEHRGIGTVRSV